MNKFDSLKWTGYIVVGSIASILIMFTAGIIFSLINPSTPLRSISIKKTTYTDTIYIEEKVYDTIHIKVYDTVPVKAAPPKEPIKLDTTTSKIELIQD
jgi:hypothetical protein